MATLEKGRKLLLTIKKRYGIEPMEVQRLLSTGRMPNKVEWAFMEFSDSNKLQGAIDFVSMVRYSLEKNFISVAGEWLVSPAELERKGWFYNRIPSIMSEYFEKIKKE